MTEYDDWPVVIAKCHREWPVLLGIRVGRCGDCGEQPLIDNYDPIGTVKVPKQ